MTSPRPIRRLPARLAALPRPLRLALPAGVVALVVLAAAIPYALASSASYFSRYPDLKHSYETLQASEHRGLACDDCHAGEGSQVSFRVMSAAGFYRDLLKRPSTPAFSKMAKPTREACIRCHEEDWSDDAARTMKIPHPAHLRVSTEKRDCVTCHKWTAHEEEYMERHETMPFSGLCVSFGCHVGTKSAEECADCHHALDEDQSKWLVSHKTSVQNRGAGTCLEICHQVDQCQSCHTTGHKPNVKGPKRETGFQALQRAHAAPDWMERHGKDALEDESQCMSCHVSKGECNECHSHRPAFHGPEETWLVEHKDFSKDERRCLACHKKPWCEECHAQFKESW